MRLFRAPTLTLWGHGAESRIGKRQMLLEHGDHRPRIADSAWVAPTAVLCGDVRVGSGTCISFGAVLVAEGAPIVVGRQTIIREHALLRSTPEHPLELGDYVLVGPRAALYGCRIEDEVFLATGATVFHGAQLGRGAEVRINMRELTARVAAGLRRHAQDTLVDEP